MPIPLDPYFRRRIVTLWKSGENISSIVRVLQTEGRKTTRKTVRRWIFRWQYNRGLKDSHRSGRLLKITRETAVYMDEQLKEDAELSSVELQRLVSRKFTVKLSPSTIRRYLRTHALASHYNSSQETRQNILNTYFATASCPLIPVQLSVSEGHLCITYVS